MKQPICIGLVIIAMLVVLGVGLGQAQGLQDQADRRAIGTSTTSAAEVPWFIDIVDSPEVGEYVSVAVHPKTGVTYVSYYDQGNYNLHLATYVGSGGDCGPNDTWTCETVDSEAGVGRHNSIAVYPGTYQPNSWKLGIAYFDDTNDGLKFAEYAFSSEPPLGYKWSISAIDTGGGFEDRRGLYASLGYDSAGMPHIAYYRTSLWDGDFLRHAYGVHSGGNCGPSLAWRCDTVDTGAGIGQYASLDLDSNDDPWIAYYSAADSAPKVAEKVGASWSFHASLHQSGLDTGKHVSLALDEGDTPHIAYQNVTSDSLEYAKYVGTGGNCGFNGASSEYEWQCDEIEGMGTPTGYRPMSIAIDEAGYPIIAYQDTSGATVPATLKVARPIYALGPPWPYSGNCGPTISPPPRPRRSWQCDTVDDGDLGITEAGSVSLAMSPGGLATIAYHEHRLMLPDSVDSLKVVYQRRLIYLPLVLRDSP